MRALSRGALSESSPTDQAALDCIRIVRSAFLRLLPGAVWLLGEPAGEVFQNHPHRSCHQPGLDAVASGIRCKRDGRGSGSW
jgi:hypothetical protein